ncbi:MAG: excinuclease ABC subunit UvrA, partial [Deltaproteobacteria bacterium]|nr:excinuclease ABC subunit UvrA [Deltaproteobacteria bacterium]
KLSPQLFSFNSPIGMCPDCHGIGYSLMPDVSRIVPDGNKTLKEGAIEPWARSVENETGWSYEFLVSISGNYGIDLDTPFYLLPEEHKNILMFGTPRAIEVNWHGSTINGTVKVRFEGVANTILRRFRETKSEEMGRYYMRYLKTSPCESCAGTRLRNEARSVYVCGETICSLFLKSISELYDFTSGMKLTENQAIIAAEILKEVGTRLKYLNHLGLNYLTLSRSIQTLSGGESQRIRLASQLGSELTGVMYILDEPSIGLHPKDNGRLISILKRLRDLGNSVIVVEHDRDTIVNSDYVVDFGPGAGRSGGEIVFTGKASAITACRKSLTGGYISGKLRVSTPGKRRKPSKILMINNIRQNNIKGLDVKIPLSVFTVVTGVSGAGKSTLVSEALHPALAHHLNRARDDNENYGSISGLEHLDKVVSIDQDPIGRTPRSNPATYTKSFDLIRSLFSQTKEARIYGYSPGRFSFNVRGGRCEKCQGGGVIKVEMHFLPDVYITCEECGGKRFNDATLRVKFKGLNIADVLELTVDESAGVFEHHRGILKILKTLQDVGLGYIALGQPSTTLSGGEAQRIKLARELSRTATGRTVYIMDEPSTGLHFDDIKKLLSVVNRLVDMGNTVIMIEHNLDIIKTADYIIDLGPEGGDEGGRVVACGTPEEVAKNRRSHTGGCLKDVL